MSETEKFGLKSNPFHHLVKDENVQVWAGMSDTKNRIQDVVRSVQPDDIGGSEFVILVGGWGSGKTHALRYFTHKIHAGDAGYPFYVSSTVRGDKNIFASMFASLVDECGDSFFRELGEKIRNSYQSMTGAEAESAFDPVDKPLAIALKDGKANAKFLKEKALDDARAAVWLASLIKVMTTSIGENPPPYPAAYLFLDEVEEIVDQKPAVSLPFWRACRELVNRIDGRFAMIFSFSQETAVLDAAIPPAMLERRTRPYIEVKDMELADAKQFVRDFLKESRIPGFKAPHPFYPFTEDAVDIMLEREQQALLPRRIIMMLGRVFKRGGDKLGEQKEFSKEIAEEVLDEMGV